MNFAPIHQQCSLHQISQQVPYTLNGKNKEMFGQFPLLKLKLKSMLQYIDVLFSRKKFEVTIVENVSNYIPYRQLINLL